MTPTDAYAVIGKKLTGALSPKRITALINLWGFVLMTPMGLYAAWQFDFAAVTGGSWALSSLVSFQNRLPWAGSGAGRGAALARRRGAGLLPVGGRPLRREPWRVCTASASVRAASVWRRA
jgi:hypothetical protein